MVIYRHIIIHAYVVTFAHTPPMLCNYMQYLLASADSSYFRKNFVFIGNGELWRPFECTKIIQKELYGRYHLSSTR